MCGFDNAIREGALAVISLHTRTNQTNLSNLKRSTFFFLYPASNLNSAHIIQWNLHNTDTIGTLQSCPYYRGVLSSEAVQATPL